MTQRAWMVPTAAALATIETAVLIAVLLSRDSKAAPLYAMFLLVKLPFCALLLRRSAGAWLALMLYEGTGVFAALAAPRVPGLLRATELSLAAAAVVLLVAALPLFPRMEHA